MTQSTCSELCGNKDEKLGHKGADGAVAIEVHLDGQEQVPGLRDGLGEGHHPTVVVHLPGGEKALLIAAGDGQLHAVPGDGTGGAHAENHRGHLDVGGEREVVVGYSQRQLVALLILMARQALTAGVCGAAVVLRTLKGQAAEATLDVEAGLIDGAVVYAGHTLVNVLAVAAVGGQPVSGRGTAALEASRDVDAAVGADMAPGGQGALVDVFAGDPVHVTELVAAAAVALIGAIDVGALLAAGAAVALIHVFTGPAVGREPEAHGAAAVVGARRVLTLVAAQAPGVAPALIDVHTCPADAIEIVTSLALAAEAPRGVHTEVPRPAGLRGRRALVHINTAGSLLVEMVATATVGHVLLARIGALRVDACVPHRARGTDTQTLIDINTVA